MDASYHPAGSPDRLPAESEQKHPGHPTPSNEAQGVVPRGRVAGCHPQRSPHVKTQWLNEDESVGLWLTFSWGAGSFLPQAPPPSPGGHQAETLPKALRGCTAQWNPRREEGGSPRGCQASQTMRQRWQWGKQQRAVSSSS